MALQGATIVDMGKVVGGVQPDLASAIGYKETVGTACKNPNGYTQGSCFVNTADGYLYEATTAISYGTTLTSGTNCSKTDVCTKLKEAGSASLQWTKIDEVSKTGAAGQYEEITVTADISNYKEFLLQVIETNTSIVQASAISLSTQDLMVWETRANASGVSEASNGKFIVSTKRLTIVIRNTTSSLSRTAVLYGR